MNISDYKIWTNPEPKEVTVINREKLDNPKWLVPQTVNYIIDGTEKTWEDVPRSDNTDVVAVVPVLENKNILLIEERRIPFITEDNEWRVIGLPAGLVDRWEDIKEAVMREMQEEIGHESNDVEFFTRVTSSEWMTNEQVNIFIAKNCKKVEELLEGYRENQWLIVKHESAELIDAIYSVPYDEIDDFLDQAQSEWMQRGSKVDVGLRAYAKYM